MKSLKCSKICDKDCCFEARAESERKVVQSMLFHGENHHRDLFTDLNDMHRQWVMRKMHSLITEN